MNKRILDKKYYNQYMKKRYEEKRKFAINYLGGKCVRCEAKEELEFDHINRENKTFTIADGLLWAEEKLIEELNKCQLLCSKCHIEKTMKDLNQKNARKTHGTLSSYKYCKCKICKKAHSEYCRNYNKTHIRKRDRK